MKIQNIYFVLLLFLLSIGANAQSNVDPRDAKIEHNDEMRPCLQVNVDPEPKTMKEAWKNYLKDNYGFKLKGIGFLSNKDLLSAEEVVVDRISSKPMDFFTYIVEDDNGSEMKVFARYGYGIYINEKDHPNDYRALNIIFENFLKEFLPVYYQNRVNDTEKRLEELTKETGDLKDEIEDNTESIEKLKKEIEDLEKELESNNKLLEEADKKLTKRKEKLERIKNQLKKQ